MVYFSASYDIIIISNKGKDNNMNKFNFNDVILLTNYHFDNSSIRRFQPMTPDEWLEYVQKLEDYDSDYVIPPSAANFWQFVVSQPGRSAEIVTFDKKGAFHDAVRFVKGLKV